MKILETKTITIFDAISNIEKGKYVIPIFQRDYVWDAHQIENLWDSLLKGFPINNFLFWSLDQNNTTKDMLFCQFLKSLTFNSQKQADNIQYDPQTIDISISNIAVLDGQQRLTSLYSSLLGSFGIRQKGQRRSSCEQIDARLFIELNPEEIKSNEEDEDDANEYQIILSDKTSKIKSTWFEIKSILNPKFKNDKNKAIEQAIESVPNKWKESARSSLLKLYEIIFNEKLIAFTEIKDMNQDEAINAFIRLNTGGKKLSKSDITMSMLKIYWPDSETEFRCLLNDKLEGFSREFIIRTALMIYDDVTKSTINKITAIRLKDDWQKFCKALNETIELLMNKKIRISHFSKRWNVLIPIIYSIYHNLNTYKNFEDILMAYLYRAIFFGFFYSSTTNKLQKLKNEMNKINYQMSLNMLNEIRELKVTEERLKDLMNYKKGDKITNEILYFLSLDWINSSNHFDIDHLHPFDRFTRWPPIGVELEKWNDWTKKANSLPNLSYLIKSFNRGPKGNKSLREWVDDLNETEKLEYLKQAFIPNVDLDITNFEEFYKQRSQILIDKIKILLK